MLSPQDNETLVRTGAGTLMGDMMRAYWMPALLSSEVPENDGTPIRVRLMGEDLVAFRDTEGRVGLLQEKCPHRGASLVLAANEECGLRCLYHGWKFNVEGEAVDQPTEAGNPALKRIRAKAYPTREAGGMVWAYLGEPGAEPAFPDFEWLALPSGQVAAFKVLGECNYAQLLEGSIDTVHAGVLHRAKPWTQKVTGAPWQTQLQAKLEVEYTSYGMRYAGVRDIGNGSFNARITPVVMPFYTLIPTETGPSNTRRLVNAFVPRDDESTWLFQFSFDYSKPVDREFRINEGGLWVDENFRKLSNSDNLYKQNRVAMKGDGNMSGITGIMVQDHAVGETQGKILDRSNEHLGTSDLAVVAWRRMMLKSARAFREGQRPVGSQPGIPFSKIKAEVTVFKTGETWKERAPLADGLAVVAA